MEIQEFLKAVGSVESGTADYWIAAERFGESGKLMVQAVNSESREFIMNLANDTEMDFGRVMKELEVGKPKVPVYAIYFF